MEEETTIELRDVIKIIEKRRKLIFNTFLTFVILATILSFVIPPTYEGESTLRIKQPKGLGDSLLADLPTGSSSMTKQQMSTYAEIIKSRTVVQEVIDKTQSDKDEDDIPTYADMLKRITTQPVKDTEILNVRVTAKSPEEAELVTNTLVNTFLNRMTNLVRSEQEGVRQFIGERLQESKQNLEQAESNLEKYKSEQHIVSPSDETKAMIDRMSDVYKLMAENKVAIQGTQAKLSVANQEIGREKPGFVADSPLIQQYKGKLADLEVQLATLTQTYTGQHPQVLATRAAIAETRDKLQTEAARIAAAETPSANPVHVGLLQAQIQAEADLSAATAQQAAINSIIAQGDQELSKVPAKEQGMAKVMRDAEVAQEIYVMLAKRHEEARISEVMQPTDVQVIDVAIAPEKPIRPRKALNIAIAAVLGLFVGTGWAFTLEYLNKSIRTADDVKQYLDLPVLGNIPDFDAKQEPPGPGIWTKIQQMMGKKMQRGV